MVYRYDHRQKYFNASVSLSPEDKKSVESISKNLCKAASRSISVVGVPRNLKEQNNSHKDSLNRLTDAIKLYRQNSDF